MNSFPKSLSFGLSACRYWNDPKMLEKFGQAMGGTFPGMGGIPGAETAAANGAAGGEEEEEEEEELGEATVHSTASAGAFPRGLVPALCMLVRPQQWHMLGHLQYLAQQSWQIYASCTDAPLGDTALLVWRHGLVHFKHPDLTRQTASIREDGMFVCQNSSCMMQ